MRFAVILAGGSGKRLWPLSRTRRPKQLLPLVEGKSLLDVAIDRLEGLFDEEHILIVTNADYADQIAEARPHLPRENIIGEPVGRDTANAVALAAQILTARDPEATMAVFTADHVIRPLEALGEAIHRACDAAETHPDALVTFGVQPTWPHTGLGYIHCGKEVEKGVREVEGFKEKPDRPTARRYVDSGEYYWNSGMFVWRVKTIRDALLRYLPETMAKLQPVLDAVRGGEPVEPALTEAYPDLQKISIDFAVMEKAPKVFMVPLACEWLDVGSWPALQEVLEHDDQDNVVVAAKSLLMDSFRNIVVAEDDHLIAVLGMDDCIVVHSPDATLVCSNSDAQRLKELVSAVEKKFGEDYV